MVMWLLYASVESSLFKSEILLTNYEGFRSSDVNGVEFLKENQQRASMWDPIKDGENVSGLNVRKQVTWNRPTSPGVHSSYTLNNANVFKNEPWLCDIAVRGQVK